MDNKYKNSTFQYNQKALNEFYKAYPEFMACGELEMFSCLYYPIGKMELELIESCTEEFETIEHSLLELMYSGITQPEELSNVMGLPQNYVMKLLRILEGYGHLIDGQLTDLGMKSIEDEVKYVKYPVQQKVQVDLIHGTIFSKEMYQSERWMEDVEETNSYITHAVPDPILDTKVLDVLKEDIFMYRRKKQKVFHVNVESVEKILSKEIQYGLGFLMKVSGFKHPFMIAKCRRYQPEVRKTTYFWKPVAISESDAKKLKESLQNELIVIEDKRFTNLYALYKDIEARLKDEVKNRKAYPRRVERWIERDWSLSVDGLPYDFNKNQLYFYVDSSVINEITIQFLKSLQYYLPGEELKRNRKSGEPLIPSVLLARNDKLPGVVTFAFTNDPQIWSLAEYIQNQDENIRDHQFYAELIGKLENPSDIEESLRVLDQEIRQLA